MIFSFLKRKICQGIFVIVILTPVTGLPFAQLLSQNNQQSLEDDKKSCEKDLLQQINLNSLQLSTQKTNAMTIATYLHDARGTNGGSVPYIRIDGTRYSIKDFWKFDPKKPTSINEISFEGNANELITKYSNYEITEEKIKNAYKDVNDGGGTLWNYLRPFLQYYYGPNHVAVSIKSGEGIANLLVGFGDFKLGKDLELTKINVDGRAANVSENSYLKTITHGLYNAVTYKNVEEVKQIFIWHILRYWLAWKYSQNDQQVDIAGKKYDFNLLFSARSESTYAKLSAEVKNE